MEVTTVSPSPASPTEGDDLCETDVTKVPIHIVTLLICLCGLVGNGAVCRTVRPKNRNSRYFSLALADFLFLLFAIPSVFFFLREDLSCSPIMPLMYMSFIFQLSVLSYFWGLLRLVSDKSVLYMHRLCRLFNCCQLPSRLVSIFASLLYWASFALFTAIPMVTSLCPSHEQEHCRVALISIYAIILLLCVAPVVISSTIDIIKAKLGSQQQQPKLKDTVIFIIALFTLLLGFCNFLHHLGYIPVSTQVVFLFTCIYCSIKPFIYFLVACPIPMKNLIGISLEKIFLEKED